MRVKVTEGLPTRSSTRRLMMVLFKMYALVRVHSSVRISGSRSLCRRGQIPHRSEEKTPPPRQPSSSLPFVLSARGMKLKKAWKCINQGGVSTRRRALSGPRPLPKYSTSREHSSSDRDGDSLSLIKIWMTLLRVRCPLVRPPRRSLPSEPLPHSHT